MLMTLQIGKKTAKSIVEKIIQGGIGELIYSAEHLSEVPIDYLLFGETRSTSDSWLMRCMGGRVVRFWDSVNFYYFLRKLERGDRDLYDQWHLFVKWHNSAIHTIMECSDYGDLCSLSPRQFKKKKFSADRGVKYLIPAHIKLTKERLRKWLVH